VLVFCFVCLHLVYGGVQHILCWFFAFFVFIWCMVVSSIYCVGFLLCLSSSCVWYARHHHTPDEDKQSKKPTQYMLDTTMHQMKTNKAKNQHNICWTPPCTR
jgi:hypothetical protein